MRANKNPAVNVDVEVDLYPFLVGYKDGRVERLLSSRFVAASESPTANRGVATRDVVIDRGTGVSARLFLPTRAAMAGGGRRRLPLVVYIHGGSFCTESAFCRTYHGYATSLAAAAGALVVSVEYRLAPEHPIPAAYDDAWSTLRWAASLADPWLAGHADPARAFLAGDSAGGNIAFHTAVRAGREGVGAGVGIEGLVVVQPYFWGAERLPSEAAWEHGAAVFPPRGVDGLWPFVTAGRAGNEDPRLDPPDEEIAALACRRVLVAVAGRDTLRERGCRLFARIRGRYDGGGEATLVESEGEDHGFHLYSPLRATSRSLMASIASFINNQPEQGGGGALDGKKTTSGRTSTVTTPERIVLGVPSRPFRDIFFGCGTMDMKHQSTTCTMTAYGGKAASTKKASYGLFTGPVRPNNKAYKGPPALAGGTQATKNFFWPSSLRVCLSTIY